MSLAEYLKRASGLHDAIGGILRCESCSGTLPLGDTGSKLRAGWPECCGFTMRWVTQRELDAEAAGTAGTEGER